MAKEGMKREGECHAVTDGGRAGVQYSVPLNMAAAVADGL